MQDTTTVNMHKSKACSVMLQPYIRWRIIPAISKVCREIMFIRVTVLVVQQWAFIFGTCKEVQMFSSRPPVRGPPIIGCNFRASSTIQFKLFTDATLEQLERCVSPHARQARM